MVLVPHPATNGKAVDSCPVAVLNIAPEAEQLALVGSRRRDALEHDRDLLAGHVVDIIRVELVEVELIAPLVAVGAVEGGARAGAAEVDALPVTVRVGLVVHGHVDFDEGVRLVRDVARRQPQHVGRDEEAERAVAAGADAVDADGLVDIVGRLGVGDIAVALAEIGEIPGEVGDQFLEVGLHRAVLGPEPVERRVGRLGPVLQLQELLHLLLDLGLPGDGANRLRGQVGGGERVGDGAVEVGTIGSHAVAQVDCGALTTEDVVVVGAILVEVDFEAGQVGVVVDDICIGRDRGNRRVDVGRDRDAHPEPPLEDMRVVG